MITAFTAITFGILATSSLALLSFGVNLLYLTWSATRLRKVPAGSIAVGDEHDVCVQIPIYNERYVAERVIDAVCEMEWPRDRLEVQVLDDSDDETSFIVSRRAAHWRGKGVNVIHVRRGSREGFKAGALAHGLGLTRAPGWLFPAWLDGAARRVGNTAWRYMQWTRRDKPDALARVAYVRATMRPYTLFDEPDAS